MVDRVVRDIAGAVFLLEPADAVLGYPPCQERPTAGRGQAGPKLQENRRCDGGL